MSEVGGRAKKLKGFFAELPAELHSALKTYCDARGVSMRRKLADILLEYLRREGYLDQSQEGELLQKKPSLGLDSLVDEEEEKRMKIYKKKRRELNRVKKEIEGGKLDEIRKLARECGLRPDPEETDIPLLESIEPAIRNILIKFNEEKDRFNFSRSELDKYMAYLETVTVKEELILSREIRMLCG